MIDHWRTQFAVGEGSFHAGHLRWHLGPSAGLVYVYDCGAQPPYRGALVREITELGDCLTRVRPAGPHVDLLFLSHAHIDHINGAHLLAAAGISIDTVVLPLLAPEERLMAFAHAAATGELHRTDLPFVEHFTADPISATNERLRARQVVLVEPGAEFRQELDPTDRARDERPWTLTGGSPRNIDSPLPTTLISDNARFEIPAVPSPGWVLITHVDTAILGRKAAFRSQLAPRLSLTETQLHCWVR